MKHVFSELPQTEIVGCKDKLGSISKEGDRYLRSLIKRTQVGITFSGMRCSATEIGIPDLL